MIQLAEIIIDWSKGRSLTIVGLAGLPGSGKTTLGSQLSKLISEISGRVALSVSLDDFYLTPPEREALGLRWRAVAGSHDLRLLDGFLSSLESEAKTIEVPRYDTRAEVRLDPLVQAKPEIVIFDGWLIGARACGYEALEDSFDRLIFIDMDLEVAHQSRLQREARIRAESNGQMGMSAEDTAQFWNEALLPTGVKCVAALRNTADLVLKVDEAYRMSVQNTLMKGQP